MKLKSRRINVTFQLGEGQFGEGGFDTVKLEGLRCVVNVDQSGGYGMGVMNLRVYGMNPSVMNQLSTMGMRAGFTTKNRVLVEAGDQSSMSLVFDGTISQAWVDFQDMPNVALTVVACAGLIESVRKVQPSSYSGTVDVATIMADLAKEMGLAFSNNGVSFMLDNPTYNGTGRDQVVKAAEAAGINFIIDRGVLEIWPKNGTRGGFVPLISSETGLIGYPAFNAMGLTLKTEFNPGVAQGRKVRVESSLPQACGTWAVSRVDHDLSSELPGGPWMSTLEVTTFGLGI